ncbi:t-SNARE [Nadsonia fulvescens var. elongata DSM 6958]|uniref:t-SNARE n=1 Tax=Nadsonia fulvescens var. elongata DSM 6958 TaxID=857566 RepID=A0A1E3PFT5_9ASCO|nr:t-SNARE [Nadsonia fulvescens var. elongata DSM 6958]
MYRDRTKLYISYRQSYSHHPQSTGSIGFRSNSLANDEEQQGLMTGSDDQDAIELSSLPPAWIDIGDEVNEMLTETKKKITELDTLHKRNILPGFDDRSHEEKEIESLTLQITQDLHYCHGLTKKLDTKNSPPPQNEQEAANFKMKGNMKVSLATTIQEVSTLFRKMQSNYLRSLSKNDPYMDLDLQTNSDGLSLSANGEDDMDKFSKDALQQSSSLMLSSNDAAILQREQEINKIAQGIIEISAIFKDLQTMVIDQGTLLDRIDYNIENMNVYVKQADKELIKAGHYQKRTQKCKVIFLLTLVIFGLIIVLIVKPKHHNFSSEPAPAPPPTDNIEVNPPKGADVSPEIRIV